jgi:hypothetical protein
VGIGKTGKVAYPGGPGGDTIASELPLAETLLQQFAAETGGHYYRIEHSEDLKPIVADIEKLETVAIHLDKVGEHADWYWLPLLLGLVLLFIAQHRAVTEVLP